MSFNAFPIPDILEQLKSPVVDDKIHDIAERKHVFEGPMRLSPGRLYFLIIEAKNNAQTLSEVVSRPVKIGDKYLGYIQFEQTRRTAYFCGLAYMTADVLATINITSRVTTPGAITSGGSYSSVQEVSGGLLLDVQLGDDEEFVNFMVVEV